MHTTPIYEAYKNYEAVKLIDFGGWDLPVNFKSGIIAEHNAVRTTAGMFDVSHMGECLVEGPGARAFWMVLSQMMFQLNLLVERFTQSCVMRTELAWMT